MAETTVDQQGAPLTFHNAPTDERNGRRYLSDDAARELGDRLAETHAGLLRRLAEE